LHGKSQKSHAGIVMAIGVVEIVIDDRTYVIKLVIIQA
jgi:hypothetical protein